VALLAIATAFLALVQGIYAVVDAPAWLRIVTLVLVLVVAVALVVVQQHDKRKADAVAAADKAQAEVAKQAEWVRSVVACLRRWPPRTAEEEDAYELGVKKPVAAAADQANDANDPGSYVSRDADRRVRERLAAGGAVLIIGEPASGMTRTVFRGLTDAFPRAVVVAPHPSVRDGLRRALEDLDVLSQLPSQPRLVALWLDRIDVWLRDGLSASLLQRSAEKARLRGARLRVFATISTRAYREWGPLQPDLFAEFSVEVIRDDGKRTLGPVLLERLPSERELAEAQQIYPGMDFTEGIAAAFTVTGSLVERWKGGYGDCPLEPVGADCPLARSALGVAVDWQRTGTPRRLPRERLLRLAPERSAHLAQAHDQHMREVLSWASERTREGAGLIIWYHPGDTDEAVVVDDQFADVLAETRAPVPGQLWDAALSDAYEAGDSEAVGRIGFQAHVDQEWNVATAVWAEVASLDTPAAEWLHRADEYSGYRGDLRGQLLARERLFYLTVSRYGAEDVETGRACINLGTARQRLGHPEKARDYTERALRIFEAHVSADDLLIADALNNLGAAWSDLGNAEKARDYYERALRIREAKLGADDPVVAEALDNLGTAWMGLGNAEKARGYYERALRIREAKLGADHAIVAGTLNNLGFAWRGLDQPEKARDYFERSLRIREAKLGGDNPLVALTLNNLGAIWVVLGQPEKARDCLLRALRIREAKIGADHPDLAGTLNNLVAVYMDLDQPEKARDYGERALRIYETRLGGDHPHVGGALSNLGRVWMGLGQPEKARRYYERAQRIREAKLGADHPDVARSLHDLGILWIDLGQPEKARAFLERALRAYRSHLPASRSSVRQVESALHRIDPDAVRIPGYKTARLPDHAEPRAASESAQPPSGEADPE
jgi:tetratricopeptide (TPR) repeat protein